MQNPLNERHAAHTLRKIIPAADYNRVQLALQRISNPLILDLQGMRCLDIFINKQYWLVTDRCMEDRWVMAWTDFQCSDRSAIHTPINCELRLYHVHAGLVMGEVLETLGITLCQQLKST